MIVVIRIKGMVDTESKSKATLERLRLRRKFSAVLLAENREIMGMLKRVQHYVSYGKISKELVKELITKRGLLKGNKPVDKKIISDKFIDEIYDGKKKISDAGIKPFFRLHPPIGGFKKGTRLPYPQGVLGNNKEIDKLLVKML